MLSVFLRSSELFSAKRFAIDSKHLLLGTIIFSRGFTNRSLLQSAEIEIPEAPFSASILKPTELSKEEDSYTVSYLRNSCGFSKETAISVSEKVQFKTPERPDSVLAFLRIHGFNKKQIAELVRKRPSFLLSSPEKTLLPKFEFFRSVVGLSNTDLATILSKDPNILTRSLVNQLVPTYNFLKSVLLSNEQIIKATKHRSWILADHSKIIAPNIGLLRELKVPESKIILLLVHHPRAILEKHDQFRKTVNDVKKMGFDPSKTTFVLAVHALTGNRNKLIRDQCNKTYTEWGWSKDEILLAFRKNPQCMLLSDNNICRTMDFLLNKMGRQPSDIKRYPQVLFLSLEKRIIPRCSVVRFLCLKGFIRKDVCLSSILIPVEKNFLERFVIKYEKEVPNLLQVYQGKVDVLEL